MRECHREGKRGDASVVRIAFMVTAEEAKQICALRFELKPSTAAAQIVRMALGGALPTTQAVGNAQDARLAPCAQDKADAARGEEVQG